MVKVAMVSDLHLDINKVDIERALQQQSHWLKKNQVGIYLIAGDLFKKINTDIFKSLSGLFEQGILLCQKSFGILP